MTRITWFRYDTLQDLYWFSCKVCKYITAFYFYTLWEHIIYKSVLLPFLCPPPLGNHIQSATVEKLLVYNDIVILDPQLYYLNYYVSGKLLGVLNFNHSFCENLKGRFSENNCLLLNNTLAISWIDWQVDQHSRTQKTEIIDILTHSIIINLFMEFMVEIFVIFLKTFWIIMRKLR